MTPAVLAALAQCGRKCANSHDGRTAAGAVREATHRLIEAGYRPQDARNDAEAMRRVGAAIRGVSAR